MKSRLVVLVVVLVVIIEYVGYILWQVFLRWLLNIVGECSEGILIAASKLRNPLFRTSWETRSFVFVTNTILRIVGMYYYYDILDFNHNNTILEW